MNPSRVTVSSSFSAVRPYTGLWSGGFGIMLSNDASDPVVRNSCRVLMLKMPSSRAACRPVANSLPFSRYSRLPWHVPAMAMTVGVSGYYRTGTPLTRYGFSDGYGRYEFFLSTVHPDDRQYVDTQWAAGLRGEINLPYECRNGGCGMCKCTVLHGEVDPGIYQPSILSAEERAQGKVLMCCASPLSDIEIEYEPQAALTRAPVKEFVGTVDSMERLSHDVMGVVIKLPEGEHISFSAGQYINIILEDGERRAFSFASAPHNARNIELQIRLVPGGRFTTHVFEKMKVGASPMA